MNKKIELVRGPDRSSVRRRIPTEECFFYEEPTVVDRPVYFRAPQWILFVVGCAVLVAGCLTTYHFIAR